MKKTNNKSATFDFDETTGELTDQQELFCMEYIRCKFNKQKAMLQAGYSPSTAKSRADRLMSNPKIQNRIREFKKNISLAIGVDAIRIAQEYANIGLFDISKFYTAEGALKPVNKIDKKARAAISGIEVFEVFGQEGVVLGVTKKLRTFNKIDALDKLAKMLGVDGVTKIANTDTEGNPIRRFINLPNGAKISLD